MTPREEILARIHTALGPAPPRPPVPREYRQAEDREAGSAALVERFCERTADYAATVLRTGPAGVEASIAEACAERGSRRLATAPAVPWSPSGVELVPDDPERDPRDLEAFDAALTGCALAVAETGTIALDGGPLCGRRALTLIPDHHICVVRSDQIVATVPDGVAALAPAARGRRPVTLISGPSATSDIELQRVEGVHGPRLLDVVVVS
jgi:L-lactate dehydrogenase complex protein LldG